MDRLTYDACNAGQHCQQVKGADDDRCSIVCDMYGDRGCVACPIAKAFDRLAAYEDTELTPEQIMERCVSPCELGPEKSIPSYPTHGVDFRNASDYIEEIIKKLKAASHESLNSDAMNQMGSVVLRLIEERLG